MKRNIAGLFLFLCLIAPIAVTLFCVQLHKQHVKKEIKWTFIASMNHNELVQFRFMEDEKKHLLNWHHSKEFEYKGEMYDVVKCEQHGDTTYYWCWWDHEETELNKKLEELVAVAMGNTTKQQENKTRLFKFLDSLYFLDNIEKSFLPLTDIQSVKCSEQNLYQSILLSYPFPPPEVA